MIKSVLGFFDRLWFSKVPAARLSWIRIVVGAYAAWFLFTQRDSMVDTAKSDPAVFRPIGVTTHLSAPISPELYDSIIGVTLLLSYCFLFGIWHHVLAPIFAVLFLWVITYSTSWSMVFHTENMLVLHVLILAVSASASAVSIDIDLTRKYPWLAKLGFSKEDSTPDPRYCWPIRSLQLAATLPYVVAGLAKVRGDMGWSWALGENLRDQITMNGLYYDVLRGYVKELTYHVYEWQYGLLFMFSATMTLVIELGAPLALLNRYLGYFYVVSIMAMHWSILWLMGIPFRYQLYGFAYASFFEIDLAVDWVEKQFKRRFPDKNAESSAEEGAEQATEEDAEQATEEGAEQPVEHSAGQDAKQSTVSRPPNS